MNGMTVLVSPLNWGFGHAGRMIPVALELKRVGCEVIFAADTSLLTMAGKELPGIRLVEIPGLRIRYSRNLPQYICIFLQLPRIIGSAITEHRVLQQLVRETDPSLIISDNRFGFYHRKVYSVYVTHQLRIPFPRLLRFMEPMAAWLHRLIISRFDLCLVPDFPGDENLSGRLSHGVRLPRNVMYTGPLSRFDSDYGGEVTADRSGNPYVCLILSGPEPQRSLLLEKAAEALHGTETVILSTVPAPPGFTNRYPSATFITSPDGGSMRQIIASSSIVIARAGYTSVMELFTMGRGAVIIPTPGQPEQEYLGRHLNGKYGFKTLEQGKLDKLAQIVTVAAGFAEAGSGSDLSPGTAGSGEGNSFAEAGSGTGNSFAEALFKKAIDYLLEHKKQ